MDNFRSILIAVLAGSAIVCFFSNGSNKALNISLFGISGLLFLLSFLATGRR